jgi:hypothetical protein
VKMKPGMRLRSTACSTEVVVVRAPDGDVEVTCCGVAMVDRDDSAEGAGTRDSAEGGQDVLIGKRYSDEASGLEVLCTKAGGGPLACNGVALVVNAPKPLPSSD